jgi:hypothetical protein
VIAAAEVTGISPRWDYRSVVARTIWIVAFAVFLVFPAVLLIIGSATGS